jgi:hypothetical protein
MKMGEGCSKCWNWDCGDCDGGRGTAVPVGVTRSFFPLRVGTHTGLSM